MYTSVQKSQVHGKNIPTDNKPVIRLGFRSILFLILLWPGWVFAQQPVQVNTILRPPYTLLLSDYYTSTKEKLTVDLTNRDLNKPVLNVRLRMTIESQGVQLRTRDFSDLPTLQLEAGVRLRLSLGDLAPYFSPENLDFSGITRAQYTQQAKLPEGFYQFCFEAIEVSTGQVASSKNCAMAWISLSDPPFLNLPRKGESIALKEPQNIIFQWTPRHLNSPNSAYLTEYDFQIVELWDNSLAPEVAFQSMQPLYETTIRTTTLLYGPSQPLLIPGKRYGWRIKARAKSGIEDVDVFRNQGFSEIYWFSYQDVCPPPLNVSADPGSFGSLEFSWMPSDKHTGYMVTYRQKDKEGATWFDQQSSSPSALIYDVEPGLEYEYRVAAFCGTDQPVFGEFKTVKIPTREADSFVNCSIVPNPTITNKQALQTLTTGNIITAGDFPIKINEVSGAGTFTGKGYVTVPFLGKAKVRVKFENIQVNTQNQLLAGQVITTYNENGIADINEAVDIFRDYQGIVSRLKGLTVNDNADDLKKVADKVIENASKELPKEEADEVKKNATELVATKKEYDEAKKAYDLIPVGDEKKTEAKAKVDELEKKFEEIKSRFEGKDENAVTTENYVLEFSPSATTKYGFDKLNPSYSPYHDGNYDFVQKENALEFISWKAVPLGGYDWVKASSINGESNLPQNIVFRSNTGTLLSTTSDKEYNVKVYGYGVGEKTEVVAYQKSEIDGKEANIELGRLNVISYQKINNKLVIVPVNNTSLPYSSEQIKTELNKIYSQAVVEWSVEVKESFSSNYDVNNNGLDDGKSEMFSNYTTEMETLINDYLKQNKLNDNTYYLFLVPGSESKLKLGYMPRKKQAGFIFMDLAKGDEFIKTVAHELGHGAFRLEHTFETYPALAKSSTDNLMDYKSNGFMLHKYQWDLVHDPVFMISLFEDDEKGEFAAQLAQCLAGAGLDFAFYYSSIWITAQFDDELSDANKPGFTEFSKITDYKLTGFSWKEAFISAGISCGAATLPPFFAPETNRKIVIGLAALGGAATGFATETAKQYDVAYNKLLSQTKEKPSLVEVVPAIDWKPVILSSAVTGVITGTATWLATSPKFATLVKKIKDKLKISDLIKEKQKLIDYLTIKVANAADDVGKYTTKIRWGILDIDVRPFGKGYLGKRMPQNNPRVDAFELKINPNNESFYLPHPDGGYVQYEGILNAVVKDGKLIMDQSSIYHVLDKPEFLTTKSVLEPALRQVTAAKAAGYKVEWLVSDAKAVEQLTQYFKSKKIDITVKLFKE